MLYFICYFFQLLKMQSQHFLLLSPPKKRQHLLFNPQFKGIAKQLGKSHLNRNQAKNERTTVYNRLSYLQKQENLAQKKLNKKQKQLESLMNTIARRQADLQWVINQFKQKEAQRRAKQQAIAQQRQINIRRRSMNQQRIRESFLYLYDQNCQNSNNLRKTQKLHESMLKTMHREQIRSNKEKVIHSSLAKQEGRNKIVSYYKQKNDLFVSRYKERIKMQQQEAREQKQQAMKLKNIQGEIKLRLQKSTTKIQEITGQLQELANKSKNLSMSRSLKWSSLNSHNRFSQTKTDSFKETDLKLDKLIERELSFTEVEVSKV